MPADISGSCGHLVWTGVGTRTADIGRKQILVCRLKIVDLVWSIAKPALDQNTQTLHRWLVQLEHAILDLSTSGLIKQRMFAQS